ncbi:hypothetical protein OF83DRAFT_1170354 [Amylostereum chailletii]|nr:hypothetical protein OF83DRAFT_1170354 [Amylostereum chailletii]
MSASYAAVTADVFCPPVRDDNIRNAVQTIIAARKSRKALKGQHEAVWPLSLEVALIEGLHEYRPKISTRPFLRFPDRNVFISDYIFRATGKRRTSKQVGSRLQQLRDTAQGKRILEQFSSRSSRSPAEQSSDTAPHAPGSSILDPSSPLNVTDPDHTFVHIKVLPANTPHPGQPYTHQNIALSSHVAPFPRHLREIDPTVTFTFSHKICAASVCDLYYNGSRVYHEVTPLTCTPALSHEAGITGYVYRVALVPGLWNDLCRSNNPGRYSVVQCIFQCWRASPLSSELVQKPSKTLLRTVVYNFEEVTLPPAAVSLYPAVSYATPGSHSSVCLSPAFPVTTACEYRNASFKPPSYDRTQIVNMRNPFTGPTLGETVDAPTNCRDRYAPSDGVHPPTAGITYPPHDYGHDHNRVMNHISCLWDQAAEIPTSPLEWGYDTVMGKW